MLHIFNCFPWTFSVVFWNIFVSLIYGIKLLLAQPFPSSPPTLVPLAFWFFYFVCFTAINLNRFSKPLFSKFLLPENMNFKMNMWRRDTSIHLHICTYISHSSNAYPYNRGDTYINTSVRILVIHLMRILITESLMLVSVISLSVRNECSPWLCGQQ